MTDHQIDSFPSNQPSCTSKHTDFAGDKNDETTNTWPTGSVSGEFHLNQVDSFRFRTSLIEIVEELKLRRKNELENEERTRVLIQEKHELERKIDLEVAKMRNLEEEKNKNLTETKRKYEEKMRALEEKTRQDSVKRESMEKEMEIMKEDLRKLQLAKYSLEKLLRDQERKVQIQSDSTEHHLQQLSGVEHKLQAFSTYCTKLVHSQEHLNRQVKEAIKLNQTLKYVNQHQKCLIGCNQEVISSLEVRLLEANKRVQDKPSVSTEAKLKLDMAQLAQQLDGKKSLIETLESEIEEVKSRYNETLVKLQDAYCLIERHLANTACHRDEAEILKRDKEELEKKCEALKLSLDSTRTELDVQTSLYQQAVEQRDIQNSETAEKIEKLKADLDLSSKACQQLEELNSNWAKHNLQLSTSLQEAKAKLDVPKCDTEVQTLSSLFDVKVAVCQTSVELVSAPSQTDKPMTHYIHTQTHSPAITSKQTQTSCMPHQVASTQTKVAAVANTGILATTDMEEKGVQTLPVRVYPDFNDKSNDLSKDTGSNRNEAVDQVHGQNSLEGRAAFDTPKSSTSTSLEERATFNTPESSTSTSLEGRAAFYTPEPSTSTSLEEGAAIHDTCSKGKESPSFGISTTHVEDFSEKSDSKHTDAKFNQNHAFPASSSLMCRQGTLTAEGGIQLDCLQKFVDEATVHVGVLLPGTQEHRTDNKIMKIILPDSPKNPVLPRPATTITDLEGEQDKVIQNNSGNSCLISSYKEFGQQEEVEDKETSRYIKESPRCSGMSLSLRKPRTETKRSTANQGHGDGSDMSVMSTEKQNRTTGKFTLSSKKSGLLFEGKTLLNAYMSSRMSSGVALKQTSQQSMIENRRGTSRGTAVGRQAGQSRYSAVFRSRVMQTDSVTKGPTPVKFDQQMEAVQSEPRQNNDTVHGILKGACERKTNVKSVHFTEGPPEIQIIQECSGDQSLFSDSDEDDSSQLVSLEDFQSEPCNSEPKRRKLE